MARSDPSSATVRAVRERDDWRCARCAGWGPLSTQHRVSRGMGGTRHAWINAPQNLLTVCGDGVRLCHGWIERHPHIARAHGWAVARNLSTRDGVRNGMPPVWTWRGWVQLTEAGRLRPLPDHPGVTGCQCGCRPTTPTPGLWATPSALTRQETTP